MPITPGDILTDATATWTVAHVATDGEHTLVTYHLPDGTHKTLRDPNPDQHRRPTAKNDSGHE